MTNYTISIGDKIDLKQIFLGNNIINNSNTYHSKLLDFIGEDKVKVSVPIKQRNIVPLEVGTQYEMTFYTTHGVVKCKGEIIDRFKEGNIFILVFCFLSEFEKIQRRQFFRIDCLLDIKYRILSKEEWDLKKQIMKIQRSRNRTWEEKVKDVAQYKKLLNAFELKWNQGTVIDISGGGARFNSEVSCHKDQIIEITFIDDDSKLRNVTVYGNVISIHRLENRYGFYEYRIEFIEIENAKREKIIKFIFEEERRIRQKEKGLG